MFQERLLLPAILVLSMTASCDRRSASSSCEDADADGFGTGCAAGADCAPDDPSLFTTTRAYVDADRDGFGVGELVEVCGGDALPAGYASVAGDCDDDDPASYPHDGVCLRVHWAHVYAASLHTCALDEAGTAYCWGSNRYGQLGVGDIGGVYTSPVPVDVSALSAGTTFVHLAVATQHTCALDGEGVAYCWGSNAAGAVGQETPEAIAPAPVRIDPSAFGGEALVDIAAGQEFTCAATASGRVYCWGDNSFGGLGVDGQDMAATPVEAAVPLTTAVVHVVAGPTEVCSLGLEGDEYCWGRASSASGTRLPTFVRNAPGLIVSPGSGYQCVVTPDGVASCSGEGYEGQIGAGPGVLQTQDEVPVLTDAIPGFTGFASITAGGGVTCALTREADAYCWGNDDMGSLGTGAVRDTAWSPVAVDASGLAAGEHWVELDAGNAHVCGITSTGSLRCWGSDGWDQLGDGGEPSSSAVGRPVDASALGPGELVAQVAMGTNHACELTTLGRVLCWGRNLEGRLGIGEAGPASTTPVPIDTTSITGDTRFVQVSAGNNHSCAVAADGAAYCWGDDTYGQLGDDASFVSRTVPTAVDRSSVSGDGKLVSIVAGYNDTCAIASDGSGYCWGRRAEPGTGATVATPVLVDVTGLGGDARFVQIDAGWGGCATTADGRGVCWGGYLGPSAPTPIDLTDVTGSTTVVEMTTYWMHACARMVDDAVYCYGADAEPLGLGYLPAITVAAPSPVDTVSSDIAGFSAVDTAHLTTCALDTLGAPVCWGDDRYEILGGTAATDVIVSPVRLELGPDEPSAFSQISVGEWSACALSTDGRAFCWGYDWYAQLGQGGEPPWAASPVLVELYLRR